MFTITSTRIVGLIAGVCAAVVAPQALAATSTHNTVPQPGDPTHNTVSLSGDPSDVFQRYELRGELSDQGSAPTAFAAVPSQSPMGQPANNTPGGFDLGDLKNGRAVFTAATHKNAKAGSTAAAIKALQRRSVDLNAAYRKLYPGAYRQAAPKSSPAAVWKFPACSQDAAAEYDSYSGDPCIWTGPAPTAGTIILPATLGYMPTNPGWGAAATAAKQSAATLAVKTAPVVCLGHAAYDNIDLGCEWWS